MAVGREHVHVDLCLENAIHQTVFLGAALQQVFVLCYDVAHHDTKAGDVYCRCVFRQVADALEVETLSRAVAHQQPGAGEMGNAGNG